MVGLAGGGWVVAWGADDRTDDPAEVWQRVYWADGLPVGSDVRVYSYSQGWQHSPGLIALPDGGWVTTWQSYSQDGEYDRSYLQRLAANGTAAGSETVIRMPRVWELQAHTAVLEDGGWNVACSSVDFNGAGSDIFIQRFAANSQLLGDPTQVNTFSEAPNGTIGNPYVAELNGHGRSRVQRL